jgi:hypothetical protein
MAFADEFSPQSANCDICGAMLGDEIVVQEFADGSLARLCTECAAGADLAGTPPIEQPARSSVWPDLPPETASTSPAETDPLEKTRELLMPVTDLISLQGEMQGALERLAASLERFALEMITESQGRSAVQSRVQELEHELEKTRTQLTETEFLLSAAGRPVLAEAPAQPIVRMPEVSIPVTLVPPPLDAVVAEAPAGERRSGGERRETPATAASPTDERRHAPERRKSPPKAAKAAAPVEQKPAPAEPVAPGVETHPAADLFAAQAQTTGQTTGSIFVPAQALASDAADRHPDEAPTFHIGEVQAAQRYYNECPFVNRIRDVRRSLGKPKANVSRLPGSNPLAVVTVCWDIVWYQYLVDLRRDLPSTAERVTLYREGMDLDELAFHFREKNAVVNDDGKLDASELEVRLLSDPSALITDMDDVEETQLMDDLTEETWGSRVAPEFKWDN